MRIIPGADKTEITTGIFLSYEKGAGRERFATATIKRYGTTLTHVHSFIKNILPVNKNNI
jgi:hypothetical protein